MTGWPAWRRFKPNCLPNAPSIWWTKLSADGKNANDTTSQLLTDMGNGPAFYDNLVEISVAD